MADLLLQTDGQLISQSQVMMLSWTVDDPEKAKAKKAQDLYTSAPPGIITADMIKTKLVRGNDSVTACFLRNGSTQINIAFNNASPRRNVILTPDSQTVLKKMSSAYINGQVHCRFQHLIASNQSNIFPLNYDYYLFLGRGTVNQTTFALQKHSNKPNITQNKVNVTNGISSMVPSVMSSTTTTTTPISTAKTWNSFGSSEGNLMTFYADGNFLHLQLTGYAGEQWVAAGFSKDTRMGDDTVVSCSLASPTSTTIVAKFSYNDGLANTPVDNAEKGITKISSSINNGRIKCTLLVQASGLGNPKIFDLNNTSYFLLIGAGKVYDNGAFQPHTQLPDISKERILVMNMTNSTLHESETDNDAPLLKAHGTLMITAWVLLVNPAILLARYFKTAWPNKTLLKTAVWFTIHRTSNILALLCTIAGFVIIFVHRRLSAPQTINDIYGDNRSIYAGYYFAHAPLGIIVMILVIINPITAIFRCEPNSKNRFVFNWIHWCIGTVLQIVALINVFFGVKMGETYPDTDHRICHIAVFWILIAFVAFHIVIELALFINKLLDQRGSYDSSKKSDHEMKSYGRGNVNHSMDNNANTPTRNNLLFRYVCLAIYVTVVLGLWLAMIILIGTGKVN